MGAPAAGSSSGLTTRTPGSYGSLSMTTATELRPSIASASLCSENGHRRTRTAAGSGSRWYGSCSSVPEAARTSKNRRSAELVLACRYRGFETGSALGVLSARAPSSSARLRRPVARRLVTRSLKPDGSASRATHVRRSLPCRVAPGPTNRVSMARLTKFGERPATSDVLFDRLRGGQADAEWGPRRSFEDRQRRKIHAAGAAAGHAGPARFRATVLRLCSTPYQGGAWIQEEGRGVSTMRRRQSNAGSGGDA